MEENKLGAAILVGLQILFQELELGLGQVETPRVIEDREMRVLVVEAVVIRPGRLLLV